MLPKVVPLKVTTPFSGLDKDSQSVAVSDDNDYLLCTISNSLHRNILGRLSYSNTCGP